MKEEKKLVFEGKEIILNERSASLLKGFDAEDLLEVMRSEKWRDNLAQSIDLNKC